MPTLKRTVVRWFGVTQLFVSGVIKRRAKRASQGDEYSVIGMILF